eukprot:TRINITY_DN4674_c0_g1_i4.p1 TRINITY_DN4674_c0_g1~~TRINITY_DN4674_c0_g1_i4.p1  ORF type:complete len:484 (-),score=119.66 TRINITY_DN4674_c0_g1_i4:66-1517(-)
MCIRDSRVHGEMSTGQESNKLPPELTEVVRGKTLRTKFVMILILAELAVILLYGFFCQYQGIMANNAALDSFAESAINLIYPFYQDVHVMMFIGFGFLMTYLRTNCWTAIGINFMIGAFAIQVYVLWKGLLDNTWSGIWAKIPVDVNMLMNCDFAVSTVLISYGGILGKVSPYQMIVITIFEVFFYALNENVVYKSLQVIDLGGSLTRHAFGGYFGIILSWIISPTKGHVTSKTHSTYNSNLFAMIGTLFLWMFWPSFNAGTASGSAQHRAIVNTVLSLSSGCISAFVASSLFRGGRFNMEDILNATLAGGVAMGINGELVQQPWVALLIGFFCGFISSIGFTYIGPFFAKHLRIYDTAGIHHLHGMPGVAGGFISAMVVAGLTASDLGQDPSLYFPKRRDNPTQAWVQVAATGVSVGIAVVGGIFTGLLLKIPIFKQKFALFDDNQFWHIDEMDSDEESEEEVPKSTNNIGKSELNVEMKQN